MRDIFLTILNMSLTASYVILFVILARQLLRKAPKVISYALWGVVAFRLIVPFSFESIFSLMPRNTNTAPIPHDIVYQQSPQINSGIEVVDSYVNNSLPAPTIGASVNPLQIYMEIGSYIWAVGIIALLVYSLVSILILKKQLKITQLVEKNIYEAENLKTPFVLGLIRPKIYLPVGLGVSERSYILLHEQTHIRRKDNIIKVFAFLILSIHWFNPLVWIAFILMSKDMELSCDERVLKEMNEGMNEDIKKPYAYSLLSLATQKHILNGSPLAFGEGNVKGRIKNVLNYKKPRFWIVVVAIIAVIAVGVGLLTNPIERSENFSMDIKAKGPYFIIYLNPMYSVTGDAFANARRENEYQFSKSKFEIVSNIESDKILINNPKYEEELVGSQIAVMGDMSLDVSKYSDKKRFRVNKSDGTDTGYIIYKMDDEVWISHGGWYGENKDSWWCEYIIKIMSEVSEEIPLIDDSASNSSSTMDVVAYDTVYKEVEIKFLSDMMGFKEANEFGTTHLPIVAYIDSTIKSSLTPAQEEDLKNNHTNQYTIKLSNDIGGYSCGLYYDTLYDKAFIVNDGGLYEVGTDFARYIDSLLENTDIQFYIDDADSLALFETHGWTIDYEINAMNNKLNNINSLTGFNPNAYYFAYNNELSKDIGLDMREYSNSGDIDVKIFRLHESMPREFYPIQNSRGIVVKKNGKIIGAFISAGRHSAFSACSLKGNSFEKVTGKTLNQWLVDMIKADSTEDRLSKLSPEQVIEEYFTALDNKNANAAGYCISKKALFGSLTTNISNEELFNEGIGLPLTDSDIGAGSSLDNLRSAKLLKVELIDEPDKNTKIYRVKVNLQYRSELTISSGEQIWDCHMVYESPQTGWKIEGFGH